MNDASGIGPVAVIAWESCLARGVDHCLLSVDDHLMGEQDAPFLRRAALRKILRVCSDKIDLITVLI